MGSVEVAFIHTQTGNIQPGRGDVSLDRKLFAQVPGCQTGSHVVNDICGIKCTVDSDPLGFPVGRVEQGHGPMGRCAPNGVTLVRGDQHFPPVVFTGFEFRPGVRDEHGLV